MPLDASNIPPELLNLLQEMSSEPVLIGATDGDYQIKSGEGVIRVVPPGASTTKITLPGVAEAKGQQILIISIGNDTGTITVEEQGDGIKAFADVILTADLDYVVVKNIAGLFWLPVHEVST